jgi:hypothetical protein
MLRTEKRNRPHAGARGRSQSRNNGSGGETGTDSVHICSTASAVNSIALLDADSRPLIDKFGRRLSLNVLTHWSPRMLAALQVRPVDEGAGHVP